MSDCLKRIVILLTLFTGFCAMSQDRLPSAYDIQLLYDQGKLQLIVDKTDLIINVGVYSKANLIEIWRILILCHMHLLNYEQADYAMMQFLLLNPKYEPSSLRDGPEFVDLLYSFEVKNRIFWKTVRKRRID